MDIRITSTKETIFPKRFFPNSKISFRFWMNSKNLTFGETVRNLLNQRG
jgi:hypothetical protein